MAYGHFGSRFSEKAAKPSAAASVVLAAALAAAPAESSVINDSPIVSFSSRLVSCSASGAREHTAQRLLPRAAREDHRK